MRWHLIPSAIWGCPLIAGTVRQLGTSGAPVSRHSDGPGRRVPLSTHCPEDYFAFLRVSEVWVKPHTVSFWRRPLTAAADAISEAGFLIDRLVEARPNPELEKRDPSSFQELSTAPCFIHLRLRPAQLDGSVAGLGGSPSQSTTD
jgi:hypothetical protein